MFADRKEAGVILARQLETVAGKDVVVLALPRGGVVLGCEVARQLDVPLDIIVPRKIGHPLHPEYAIGAVDERGTRIINPIEAATVDPQWLEAEANRQRKEAQRRMKLYRGERSPIDLKGKIVILVDDGIATGLTMQLAVRSIKEQHPERIIVAVPVAPPEAMQMLAEEGAEAIVVEPPEHFLGAVGAHYRRFEQVSDDEVIGLLNDTYGLSANASQ